MIIKIPRDKVEIFEVSIKQEFYESCSRDVLFDNVNDAKATSNIVEANLIDTETEVQSISNKFSHIQCEGLPSASVTKSDEYEKHWCNACAVEFQCEKQLVLHISREHASNQLEAENKDIHDLDKDPFETVTIKQEFDETYSSNILSDIKNIKLNLIDDTSNTQGHGLSKKEIHNDPNKPLHNQIQRTLKFDKENLQCAMCSERFLSKKNLIQHLSKKHTSKRPYIKSKTSKRIPKIFKCSMCSKKFNHSFGIIRHTRNSHPSYSCFVCLFCEKHFPSVTNLMKHSKTMHSKLTHACVTCWKVYTSPKCLKTHLKVCQTPLTSKVQVNCDVCGKIFKTKDVLERHLRVHMGIGYPCTECSETFLHAKTLHRHRNLIHSSFFKCNLCSLLCSDSSELKKHKARKHEFVKSTARKHEFVKSRARKRNSELHYYYCHLCAKKCTRKDDMSDHIRSIHLNEGWCKICSRLYATTSSLKRHMKELHERKNFMKEKKKERLQVTYCCTFCNKKYRDKRALGDHLAVTHYKLPKVVCEVCGLACVSQISLQRHKNRQHGKVRFSCHLCEKSYAMLHELLRHLRLAHLRIQGYELLAPIRIADMRSRALDCSKCKLKFKSDKKFMQHIQLECPGRYVCYYCNLIFDNKEKVECHIQGYHFLQVNLCHLVS